MRHSLSRVATLSVVSIGLAACSDFPTAPQELPQAVCTDTVGALGTKDSGYRGIWYANQPQADGYGYKYSGGFATYPQQHIPIAIHAPRAGKTFFVYGGRERDRNHVTNMVSFFDHRSGEVPRPVQLLSRATNDAHYNPTLALDREGYLYVFANSHGPGFELNPSDSTYRKAYIFRSTCPFSIRAFRPVLTDLFSYSQPWGNEQGLLWLHTRYEGNERPLYWATSESGLAWSEPTRLVRIGRGSYQISWAAGSRVATAFDYHPSTGGLNARTNLYYLETSNLGGTWTTVEGEAVATPLTGVQNPALVHDYQSEGLLVYLKDLKFDASGRPVILYLTSKGYAAGPASGPRIWRTARWTGQKWEIRVVAESDHNYDHGSLYITGKTWQVIAPLEAGQQPYGTGGAIVTLTSTDAGATWTLERRLFGGTRNQTYVRSPVNPHRDFYALWADGDVLAPSTSSLFFGDAAGGVYRLPAEMESEQQQPEQVASALRSWLSSSRSFGWSAEQTLAPLGNTSVWPGGL